MPISRARRGAEVTCGAPARLTGEGRTGENGDHLLVFPRPVVLKAILESELQNTYFELVLKQNLMAPNISNFLN